MKLALLRAHASALAVTLTPEKASVIARVFRGFGYGGG
jgi:hypothetical protein